MAATRAASRCRRLQTGSWASARPFHSSQLLGQMLDMATLPDRIVPHYQQTPTSSLLSLQWPQPPRNILLMPNLHVSQVVVSAIEFAKHIHANYPGLNLVFENHVAHGIHEQLPFPIYTTTPVRASVQDAKKIDLVTTLGGDGTILRAASLFSAQPSVPPILSFSMGTIGFLGEWKFDEYKRAWREAYMSGCNICMDHLDGPHHSAQNGQRLAPHERETGWSAWDTVRGNGKSMGPTHTSQILLRNRLKVVICDREGSSLHQQRIRTSTAEPHLRTPPNGDDAKLAALAEDQQNRQTTRSLHAVNEVSIDRGVHPHLAIIDIFANNHFLTEAVADGILISTPTGSTAYSLSAGGSIVHPLVKSLLITPISPRSLSFRPLVLPLNTKVVLRLSKRNRGWKLPVSVDGKRCAGISVGMEVRVEGEMLARTADGLSGGVPCVIRASSKVTTVDGTTEKDDSWVGGLNELLKFNCPFGEPAGME